MKYFVAALALLFAFFSCNKNKKKESIEYAIIKGKVHYQGGDSIILRNCTTFKEQYIPVDSTGFFSDTVMLSSKFYDFSYNRQSIFMPLTAGMDLFFDLNKGDLYSEKGIEVKGTGASIVSSYIAFSQLDIENIESYYYGMNHELSEKEFLHQTDSVYQVKVELLKGQKDSLSEGLFKECFQLLRYEYFRRLNNYEQNCKTFGANKDFEVSESYPNVLDSVDCMDSSLVDNWHYIALLHASINSNFKTGYNWEEESYYSIYLNTLDTINLPNISKSRLAKNIMDSALDYEKIDLQKVVKQLKSFDLGETQNRWIDSVYQVRLNTMPGKPCTDFAFEDREGIEYTLDSFKGRYLVLDFWATWCLPCLKEMPEFGALKQDFKDENIAFVSVCCSVTKEDTKEAWLNKVDTLKLSGLQLFTRNYGKSTFFKNLGVAGLPRFIIIDPEGNIVDASAPRPSNPRLKQKLVEILN